jgi:hypothetical protein
MPNEKPKKAPCYALTVRADGIDAVVACCTSAMYERIEDAVRRGDAFVRLSDPYGENLSVCIRTTSITALTLGDEARPFYPLPCIAMFNGATYTDYEDGSVEREACEDD